MSRVVRINTTMDEELVRRLDAFAAARFEDRSTAVRQLVDLALRELQKREAIDAYVDGRVTLRELASALGLDVWRAQGLLRAEGVPAAQGERSETAAALTDALAELDGAEPR
jgi:predicted HTH domain antitoxin